MASEQYYMSLHPEVRFQPKDEELITHFLKRKISGDPLPVNIIIDELSFYEYSPIQLSKMYAFANQKELYFFTPVERKFTDSTLPRRKARNGYWIPTSKYENIEQGTEIIGVKKSLRFYAGRPRSASTKTNWTMLEYIAGGTAAVSQSPYFLYDWVLCKVYEEELSAKKVPESNNQGNAANEEVTGEQLHSHSHIRTSPLEDLFGAKKRRRLSENSGQLPLTICTSSYRRPCLPELPFEVIIGILSRLPVESVLRFKCVCRQWCSTLQEEDFIAKHRVRASPLRLPYRYMWDYNNSVVSFLDENFKLIGECKVAYFYIKGNLAAEVGLKVLTVGIDCQWRPLKLSNQTIRGQHEKYLLKRHILKPNQTEGAAHYVEIIRAGQDLYLEVQSFDLWTECFVTTRLPEGVFGNLEKVFVFSWNHHLAVGEIVEEALNVLVLEDFKAHKWSENKIVVPCKFLKDNPSLKNQIWAPVRVIYGKLELQGVKSFLTYDMEREIVTRIEVGNDSDKEHFASHKPSLLTFKGMRPKRVRCDYIEL
ncbi:hypothetical protein Pyn_21595 [Prunus yedoensis var. nudiflora]|uniref:NAC domain-containing protein n=1 Tax=Prunus yedoensis var. nudiflora TaxID=2094558 RepID=A0A314YI65_PRUYE|nr:hypothetical protein Pyn_21595 [Prunus yedoensis var. nudiflora]